MGLIIENNILKKCIYDEGQNEIVIPNGVERIEDHAFEGVIEITSITFPNSIRSIGDYAFEGCYGLEKICVDSISSWAKIDFGRSYDSIYKFLSINNADNPFEGDVIIPDGVKKIGDRAFYGVEDMESITIPKSVKSIGSEALSCCDSLKTIYVESLKDWLDIEVENNWISSYANFKLYVGGELLQGHIDIPCDAQKVRNCCFSHNDDIVSVTIPDTVNEIGERAFEYCSNLEFVKLSENIELISDSLFLECKKLKTICIPKKVTKICNDAFKGCENLEYINIPSSVKFIGERVFYDCRNLKEVHINSVADWCDIKLSDKLFSTNFSVNVFENEQRIESLIIPDTVSHLNEYAFACFRNIKSVVLPSLIKKIPDGAFSSCWNITSISIPNSVTQLGIGVFEDCMKLVDITLPNALICIPDKTFSLCEKITNITIPSSVTSIGAESFAYCESLTFIDIPEGVTSIGKDAFKKCRKLENINIPDSVTDIENAFDGCKNLLNVSISANVNVIGGHDFAGSSVVEKLCEIQSMGCELGFFGNITYADLPLFTIRDIEISNKEMRDYLPSLLKNGSDKYYVAYAAFAEENIVHTLIKKLSTGKTLTNNQKEAVKSGLMLNKTKPAMEYMFKLGSLERYTKMHNLDSETLNDEIIPDFGLDENMSMELAIESGNITATLNRNLDFTLINSKGKIIKTISSKTQDGKNASQKISELKKEIKLYAVNRAKLLYRYYLFEKPMDSKKWIEHWTKNPLLRCLGQTIVWTQNEKEFILHGDGRPYDVNGNLFAVSEEPIYVACAYDMSSDNLELWRQYFVNNKIKQLFLQMWEPVILTNDFDTKKLIDEFIDVRYMYTVFDENIPELIHSNIFAKNCEISTDDYFVDLKEDCCEYSKEVYVLKVNDVDIKKNTRLSNHLISLLIQNIVSEKVKLDRNISVDFLDCLTIDQIQKLIAVAEKNRCEKVKEVLYEYKGKLCERYSCENIESLF